MTAGHFIFIPSVLLVGIVIGWILGSRAARDAYAAELRRREERAAKVRSEKGEVRSQLASRKASAYPALRRDLPSSDYGMASKTA